MPRVISLLLSLACALSAQTPPAQFGFVYPAPGATGVPRNCVFLHAFLSDSSFLTTIRVATPPGPVIPIEQTPSNNPLAPIWRPRVLLAANTRYEVTIAPRFATSPAPYTYSFVTGDTADLDPPRLLSVSPEPGTVGQPGDAVVFRFSEPLRWEGSSRPEWGWSNSILVGFGLSGSGGFDTTLSADRRSITIEADPGITAFELSPNLAAFSDLAGNSATAPVIPARYRYYRSHLASPEPLRVSGTYPENGQTDLPVNVPVQILFSSPANFVSPSTGQPLVSVTANGQPVATSAETFARERGLLLTPQGGWAPGTRYRVTVPGTLLSRAGLPIEREHAFEFSAGTDSVDRNQPALEAISPGPFNGNSTAYSPSTKIVIRSSNPLPRLVTQYATQLHGPQSSGTTFRFPIDVTPELSEDARTLTLAPQQPLSEGQMATSFSIRDTFGLEVVRDLSMWIIPGTASPALIQGTTPLDGATEVPVTVMPRASLNVPVSAGQPSEALRLTANGVPVAGRVRATGPHTASFVPARRLEPSTDYVLEIAAMTSATGDVAPAQTIRFSTAASDGPPVQNAITLAPPSGREIDARQTIQMTFARPVGSADFTCTTVVSVQTESGPRSWQIPNVVTWEGANAQVSPQSIWPGGAFQLSCGGSDLQGTRNAIGVNGTYRVIAAEDLPAPQLVSAEPPPGSTLGYTDAVRLTFSLPVLDAEVVPGLAWMGPISGGPTQAANWSADRRTVSLPVYYLRGDYQLIPTESLRGFSGRPVTPFQLSYTMAGTNTYVAPSINGLHPPRETVTSDLTTGITIYLDGPADPERFKRSLRVFANFTPIPGEWSVPPGLAAPTVFSFVPQNAYPPNATIRFIDFEGVLGAYTSAAWFRTAPAVPAGHYITRVTSGRVPANGVVEVELTEETPGGEFAARMTRSTGNGLAIPVPGVWRRVRPRVFRWTSEQPLVSGNYYGIAASIDYQAPGGYRTSGQTEIFFNFDVGPAVTNTRPNVEIAAPVDGWLDVPINTTIALVLEDFANPLAVGSDTATLSVNGVPSRASVRLDPTQRGIQIIPSRALPPNALVEVEVRDLQDRFGRGFPPQRWSFRTGARFDRTPVLLVWQPYPAAGGPTPIALLAPEQPIELRYNKPLDPLSLLTFDTFESIEVSRTLSADLRTLIIRPRTQWLRGAAMSFGADARDLFGNTCGGNECPRQDVRVALDADTEPPVFLSASLPDGETGVPLNPFLSFRFDSPVSPQSFERVQLFEESTPVELRPVQSYQSPPSVLRVTPAKALKPFTTYRVVLAGVFDGARNVMSGSQTFSFTTGEVADFMGPRVTVNRQVSPTGPIHVRYSEPVDPTSASTAMLNGNERGTNGTYGVTWPARLEFSADRRELTVIPTKPLEVGQRYTLNPSVMDRAGNRSLGSFPTIDLNVTDAPLPPPLTLQLFPSDGASGVPVNVQIAVIPSRTATTTVALFEGSQMILPPSSTTLFRANLRPNTTYRIEATGTDLQGQTAGPVSSTFTTGTTTPQTPLQFTGSEPAAGATNVPPDAPVTLRFNRELHPAAFYGSTVIFNTDQGQRLEPLFRTSGSSVVATPRPFWPPASLVSVNINRASGPVLPGPVDASGIGLNTTVAFSFRTGALPDPAPPAIEQVIPPSGSELPAIDGALILIRFSKPVIIPADSFRVFVNGQPAVSGCFLPPTDPATCRITVRLPAKASVTVVGTNGIRDYSGNTITPFLLEYQASEEIAAGPLRVTLVEPLNSPAPVSILPIVEFDRRMEAASVVAGMRVTQDGALVQGVVEPLEGGRRYRFRPDRPFAAGAFVRIVLPMSILTLDGRHPHDWNILGFSIRGPGSAPDKLMLTRVSVTSALPANAPLDLEFSSPLAPGSVHRDAVWLSDGHRLVPAAVELRGPASVRITPDESLTPGREYVLTIGAALRGEQAEAFPGARVVFSAGPEAAPVLVSREEIDWRGEPAWRLRFSHPITPAEAEALRGKGSGEIALAADGLMLVVPGRRTEVPEVLAPGQPVPLQRRRAGR